MKAMGLILLLLINFANCNWERKPGIQLLLPLATGETASSPSTVTTTIPTEEGTSPSTTIVELTGLTLSSGTLNPNFSTGQKVYAVTVANPITSLTILPATSVSGHPVTISGNNVVSGNASPPLGLALGVNMITISFDQGDGTIETYTIIITRSGAISSDSSLSNLTVSQGTLNPSFQASTTNYSFSLLNSVTSLTVTPTANDSGAQITVNGTNVNSGSSSSAIALNTGANAITILVTAEDLSTTTYTLNITRLPMSTYRVFVTDTFYKGNLGGVSGADTKCNSDSAKPTDGSTYKALLVDGTNRTITNDWVLKPNSLYVRASSAETIFTTNASSVFTFGTFTNSVQSGATKYYRTGLDTNWGSTANDCNNWGTNAAVQSGYVGSSSSTNAEAIQISGPSLACNQDYYILCVEQ